MVRARPGRRRPRSSRARRRSPSRRALARGEHGPAGRRGARRRCRARPEGADAAFEVRRGRGPGSRRPSSRGGGGWGPRPAGCGARAARPAGRARCPGEKIGGDVRRGGASSPGASSSAASGSRARDDGPVSIPASMRRASPRLAVAGQDRCRDRRRAAVPREQEGWRFRTVRAGRGPAAAGACRSRRGARARVAARRSREGRVAQAPGTSTGRPSAAARAPTGVGVRLPPAERAVGVPSPRRRDRARVAARRRGLGRRTRRTRRRRSGAARQPRRGRLRPVGVIPRRSSSRRPPRHRRRRQADGISSSSESR